MAQFGIDVASVKGAIPSDLKLNGLSKLRPIILDKGLTIVNKMAPPLIKEVASFDDLCPPASRLQQIIDKRNNIVDQANQIATFLTGILEALTLASTILGAILTVINVVKIAKRIVQVIAGFIPLSPGAIPAGIGLLGDALDAAAYKPDGSPRFPPLKAKIDGLLIPIAIVISAIVALVAALSALDSAIANCVIPTTGANEGGGGGGGGFGEVLRGPVLKFKIENPGANYEDGTYENVKLKGGDGKGVRATIKVSGNEVVKAEVYRNPETGELVGGDGYSTQLFDPKKGFVSPNFLYVKKGKFGKAKLDVKELLETVDLKKRIIRKIEKKKVKGDGMLLSVEEIGVSQDSGGNNTGILSVGVDGQGNIKNSNLLKGAVDPTGGGGKGLGGGTPKGGGLGLGDESGAGGGTGVGIPSGTGGVGAGVGVGEGGTGESGIGAGINKSGTANVGSGTGVGNSDTDGTGGTSVAGGGTSEIGVDPSKVGKSTDLIGIGIGTGITDGVITEVVIENQGFNCKNGIYQTQTVKGGSGENALLEITISNGSVKGVKINNGGLDYTTGEVITVDICPNASLLVNKVDSTLANPETKIVETNTGLVTSTPVTDEEFNKKNANLLAVLAGGPLQVPDANGNPILNADGTPLTLPGLRALDATLTTIAAGAQQAAVTDNDSSYKGFILEIEERDFSAKLKQRRAVAINPSGIVEAATEFSFATDEGVLIEDLKLIIDEQDLRADYAGKFDLGEQITSIESQVDLPTLIGES